MSMRRSVDVLYPFYINQVRNFLISIGNSFVSSRGVLSLRGGVFKIKMNLELSAKMMCVLFWSLFFIFGQRPCLISKGPAKYFSIHVNMGVLCSWFSYILFCLDTPVVSYNKLEVTGSRFKKNILSGNMYWVWFKLPLLTLFNFKKLLSCLQVDDVTNYHAVEFCLGLSFNKTHSGGFIEKDSFLYCIGFLADFLNLQTEYY